MKNRLMKLRYPLLFASSWVFASTLFLTPACSQSKEGEKEQQIWQNSEAMNKKLGSEVVFEGYSIRPPKGFAKKEGLAAM